MLSRRAVIPRTTNGMAFWAARSAARRLAPSSSHRKIHGKPAVQHALPLSTLTYTSRAWLQCSESVASWCCRNITACVQCSECCLQHYGRNIQRQACSAGQGSMRAR
jgi:hypothetical protein